MQVGQNGENGCNQTLMARVPKVEPVDPPQPVTDVTGRANRPASAAEARQRVERLLEGLEEGDRLMLVLKEVEGFSIEEIAEVLDLNANTVKVRLFRARRRIVKQARKRGN